MSFFVKVFLSIATALLIGIFVTQANGYRLRNRNKQTKEAS